MRYVIFVSLLNYNVHGNPIKQTDNYPMRDIPPTNNPNPTEQPVHPIHKHIKKKTKKKKTDVGDFNPMNKAPKRKSRRVTSFRSLVSYIKTTETFQPTPYWDKKQYSIGYGTKAKSKHERITKTEATRRLIAHVTQDYNKVKRFVMRSGKLNVSYVYALTDLTYNIGFGWASGHGNSLGGFVRSGNGDGIKRKILLYNKARDKHKRLVPLAGLTARRHDEVSWITDKDLPPDDSSNEPIPPNDQDDNSQNIPQDSHSPQFSPTKMLPHNPSIIKDLQSEIKIPQTSLLSYNIVKDYKIHLNTHQIILANISSEQLNILSNKNTRVKITVSQYSGSIIMENELTIKHVKILKREVDSSYTLELILINTVIDSLISNNLPHIIANSTTVYDPLTQISENVEKIFNKKLLILTNASTIDFDSNVLENMFEINEGYNRFKYEQVVIPQSTIFAQLDYLINRHYNIFNVPAMWLIDDATFTTKHTANLALYIFDPTQTKLMVMNSFKGVTDEIGGRILKWNKLFDQESALNLLNQNFVLNKASGFFVDYNNSVSTSDVILTDSIDMFNKRKQSISEWINNSPETMIVEFKGIDLTKVRHMEQYDLNNDNQYESTLLNTIVMFKQERSDLADQTDKIHDVRFVADKMCQFYKSGA